MIQNPSAARLETLRLDCHRLARGFAAGCVAVAILLLLETFGPWLTRPPQAGQTGVALIDLVAPAAYLWGLWRLRAALAAFAAEGRFLAAFTGALRDVGVAFLAGGLFQTFAAPGLKLLAGHGPGYFISLDAAAIAVAAVGAGLWAMSRLFARAARMEAELEGIL